jgi:hypothetical protein
MEAVLTWVSPNLWAMMALRQSVEESLKTSHWVMDSVMRPEWVIGSK